MGISQKCLSGIYYFFLILFFIPQYSCNTTEPPDPPPPPPPGSKAVLTIESVTCTETWLKLQLENFELPVNVTFLRDSIQLFLIDNLNSNDTIVFIDSLLPNQVYKFQSIIQQLNQSEVKSNELPVTTLDTTSHNFTYTVYEFGDVSSSILYDVAIVGEEIWAVGEIFISDTSGNYTSYNAVHWNGTEWELKRILYNGGFWVIRTIYAFAENDIWFSAFVRYNGENFIELPIPQILMGWTINKIWGTSSNDLYVVGNVGNIAHYNGSQWSRVESGTDLALTDIYAKNENEVYISGAYTPEVKGILLKGNVSGFSVVINSGIINPSELFEKLYGELAAVWIDETGTIYTGGNLLFRYKNNNWNYETSLPENFIGGNPGAYYRGFISSIRGNASNDYIIAGDRNTLRHFNGYTWEQLGLPYSPSSPIIWYSVEQKGNTAVAVGDIGSKAYIMVLKR